MVTLVITYRNRDCQIVQRCLDSLSSQSHSDFLLYLIDYGSHESFSSTLKDLVSSYSFVKLLSYPVQKQLWNKSRAINIALQKIKTEYTFVGDVDMIFRHDFISKLYQLANPEKAIFFKVGYLSQQESLELKAFDNYVIHHYSTDEATGMTLYPTKLLKLINGYDEFYHGWGSEDTDVHCRIKNAGHEVFFYDAEIFMLHQWHPKSYRTLKSSEPFHSSLEKINSQYLIFSKKYGIIKANPEFVIGQEPLEEDYRELSSPKKILKITNEENEFKSFLFGSLHQFKDTCLEIHFEKHPECHSFKNRVKKILRKKHFTYLSLPYLNDHILELIVLKFRSKPYHYEYLGNESKIILRIKL